MSNSRSNKVAMENRALVMACRVGERTLPHFLAAASSSRPTYLGYKGGLNCLGFPQYIARGQELLLSPTAECALSLQEGVE